MLGVGVGVGVDLVSEPVLTWTLVFFARELVHSPHGPFNGRLGACGNGGARHEVFELEKGS